jgi:hypothetical protein
LFVRVSIRAICVVLGYGGYMYIGKLLKPGGKRKP